jgi:hypothetical protein
MTRHEMQSSTLHFGSLEAGHLRPQVWLGAALLGVALLATGTKLLSLKGTPHASEELVSHEGSGLLTSHEIVSLVTATILLNCKDKALSKQISETLIREDRSGDFERPKTSKELAGLLTERIRSISHDERYEISYSAAPPDIAEAQGRSMYRITKHLSVGLPSQ